jgi:heme/copper-type cytochrome/quinol oxidase subunit 3
VAEELGYGERPAVGYHLEPPEVLERNISAGVRLACAALVSFYGAFLFCYVYLRERDAHSLWRPAAVKVPLGTGIAILACVLASAALTALALAALRSRGEAAWRIPAAASLLLALGALGVQCYQWAVLGFGPGSGAYASVFIAWTGFYAGVGLVSAIYWAQTTLASSIRHRGHEPGPVVTVSGAPGGEGASSSRLAVEAQAFSFYWYFLAAVQVVTFVLLYIVA